MTPQALSEALQNATSDKRLEVLRWVAQTGSISQAAREAGISYKAAWQAIDTLSSLSGALLVERTVGGAGGGGARITDQGRQLLALATALAAARQQVLSAFAGSAALAGGLGLRTSMRNQLPCTVAGFLGATEGEPALSVVLRTPDGQSLAASVTQESADLLGLVQGAAVLAMCKATAVGIGKTRAAPLPAGVCGLLGQVRQVIGAGDRAEVVLSLPRGGQWVGFAERGWTPGEGDTALATMPRSAVVIGVNTLG